LLLYACWLVQSFWRKHIQEYKNSIQSYSPLFHMMTSFSWKETFSRLWIGRFTLLHHFNLSNISYPKVFCSHQMSLKSDKEPIKLHHNKMQLMFKSLLSFTQRCVFKSILSFSTILSHYLVLLLWQLEKWWKLRISGLMNCIKWLVIKRKQLKLKDVWCTYLSFMKRLSLNIASIAIFNRIVLRLQVKRVQRNLREQLWIVVVMNTIIKLHSIYNRVNLQHLLMLKLLIKTKMIRKIVKLQQIK
jgi:hypothetical protein